MTPGQQIQRLLAEIPRYEVEDLVVLLPLVAALLSALCARTASLQQTASLPLDLPETDYLFNANQTAQRLGKSAKWVRANADTIDFPIKLGNELRWSARGLNDWISEQREAKRAKMPPALPPDRRQHER